MKKLIIAAAALMVSLAAYGQGQVVINNRISPDVVARFILGGTDPADGSASSIGTTYTVNFLGGPAGSPQSALVALTPSSSTLRGAAGTAAAGYFNGVTATVPGVAAGANAEVDVQVTGGALGAKTQDFIFTVNGLGGGTVTPPNLPMGTAPLVITATSVPEPSTLALGALGLGALLAIRRRK